MSSISAVISSLAAGETAADRPSFSYTKDSATGALSVTIDPAHVGSVSSVVLHHAETISATRRDFRWVSLAENTTDCKLPNIMLPKPVFGK